MKKRIIKILIFVLIAGGFFVFIHNDYVRYKNSDAYKFKVEYETLNGEKSKSGSEHRSVSISKKNRMKYATAEEIVKKIDKNESFAVYFGFASCPWCRSMIENLIDLSLNEETDVYYVDVLNIRDTIELVDGEVKKTKEGTKGYMELLDRLESVLSDYSLKDQDGNDVDTKEKRIYAPNVVAVVNGLPTKMVEGVSSKLTDPYSNITDEMKTDSKEQLKCIFKCLNENNVCKKEKAC